MHEGVMYRWAWQNLFSYAHRALPPHPTPPHTVSRHIKPCILTLMLPDSCMPHSHLLPHPLLASLQGFISPAVEPGTAAAVFAVYDQHQKLQYIGFSKDLRASLKTVLGRRPDKAFYFK